MPVRSLRRLQRSGGRCSSKGQPASGKRLWAPMILIMPAASVTVGLLCPSIFGRYLLGIYPENPGFEGWQPGFSAGAQERAEGMCRHRGEAYG